MGGLCAVGKIYRRLQCSSYPAELRILLLCKFSAVKDLLNKYFKAEKIRRAFAAATFCAASPRRSYIGNYLEDIKYMWVAGLFYIMLMVRYAI